MHTSRHPAGWFCSDLLLCPQVVGHDENLIVRTGIEIGYDTIMLKRLFFVKGDRLFVLIPDFQPDRIISIFSNSSSDRSSYVSLNVRLANETSSSVSSVVASRIRITIVFSVI